MPDLLGERDADDPEHPCPICLMNEDDHGQCAMCSECGQRHCGECNVPETMGRIKNCPTCRALLDVVAKVNVEQLLRLVGRSPGRHTGVALCNLGGMYMKGTGVPQYHRGSAVVPARRRPGTPRWAVTSGPFTRMASGWLLESGPSTYHIVRCLWLTVLHLESTNTHPVPPLISCVGST